MHLEKAVMVLLFFFAFKLCLAATKHMFHPGWDMSRAASWVVVLAVLAAGVLASLLFPEKAEAAAQEGGNPNAD